MNTTFIAFDPRNSDCEVSFMLKKIQMPPNLFLRVMGLYTSFPALGAGEGVATGKIEMDIKPFFARIEVTFQGGVKTRAIGNKSISFIMMGSLPFVEVKKQALPIQNSEEPKKVIEQSIDPRLTSGSENITYKEIYVTNQDSGETLHLGITIVHYSISDKKNPIDPQIKKHGFLKNTKILTKYMLKKIDAELFIYYSETFIDEKVKKYFVQKIEQNRHPEIP